MRLLRLLPRVGAAVLTAATTATAQEPARSFEDLAGRLRPNEAVRVLDSTGSETAGHIDRISPSVLILRTPSGLREWDPDAVTHVRARRSDPVWNGVLWGLAIGGGLSVAPATACENNFGCRGGLGEWFLVFGGSGAGIGAGVDALIRGHRIVYRRPSQASLHIVPLVTPSAKGAAIAVAWK